MQLRQYYALPAEGMTLEDIANGTAFDRAGRPYGTDKLATMMTGAEEWGDGITDIALVFALGPVGAVATLATSGLAGKEASARDIAATIDRAYAGGDLKDNPAFKALVEQNGGDAAAAVQAFTTPTRKHGDMGCQQASSTSQTYSTFTLQWSELRVPARTC